MPSQYLQSDDYATFGLPSSTTVAQVQQASVLIDAELRRPEGLVWMPDAGGNPAWMAAPTPAYTLDAAAAIGPGQSVTVAVTGPVQALTVGDVLILDRTNADIAEAVAVISVTLPAPANANTGSIILQSINYAHPGPCTLDAGMTIKQHKFMPQGRPLTTLAYTPAVRLLAGQGRYGYGRRGDASRYQVDEFNLLASLSHFGGPPVWEFFPMENTGVDPASGQLWVPAGVMLAYYSEINIWYVAGYAQANVPDLVKLACANVIQANGALLQLGATRAYKAGDTSIEQVASSAISDDSKALLKEFRAKLYV